MDDGSTDKTLQCAREFAEKWSCIEVFTKKNEGVGAARYLGIDMVGGNYLFFIDSDDYLLENQILDCLVKAEENCLEVCCMGIRRILPLGKSALYVKPSFRDDKVYSGSWLLLHYYFPSSACAHFFKRDFLLQSGLRFQTKIMHEDVDFQLKLFSYITHFMFCSKEVYVYEYNPNSTDRLMNLEKQKRSLWSRVQISIDLLIFSQNKNVDNQLVLYYNKVSNSQMLPVIIQLWRNRSLDAQFKKYLIEESYKNGLFPIKGQCFSWKSNVLKIFVNLLFFLRLL